MGCGESDAHKPKKVTLCYFDMDLGAEHWFVKIKCGKKKYFYQMPGSVSTQGRQARAVQFHYYPCDYKTKQEIGITEMPFSQIERYVKRLGRRERDNYQLLTNNCQDFANKILEYMGFAPVTTQVKMVTKNPVKAAGDMIKKIF